MKDFKYMYTPLQLLAVVAMMLFSACAEDLPGALDTSDKYAVLESIKIVNAGADGDVVVQGTVNEDTKEISFPRIDPETDFSALRFEIVASDGAVLENETYAVNFAEGESEKTIVIKLLNEPRYREYFAKFRLNIPVFGAEFSNAVVHDYSANPGGNETYASFVGLATRGTGFDGERVLIIDRGSAGVHLLEVSDLQNNTINRIPVNTTGVTGGTFTYNMGAQVNGHTYVASLSTSGASPLKIYHWTDPSAAPQELINVNVGAIAGAGERHGDNVSFNLDENGNGFIFFVSMQGPILRLKVTNYTSITEPTALTSATVYGQWASMLQVGNTDNYLLTGNLHPISVVSSGASVAHTMATSSIPVQGVDARIIDFNGERYLIMVTVARYAGESTTLYVYNVTPGANVVEALTNFEQTNRAPLYQYTLSSAPNAAPASQTGYHIIQDSEGNDSVLRLFAAAADAGFAIIDVPKKVLED